MSVLTKIERQHAEITPLPDAKAAGVTESGRQLYSMTRKRSRAVPKINPKTGAQEYRTHSITGEQLYKLYQPEPYEEHLLFYHESEGNLNVRMVQYTPPTEDELKERVRQSRIADMMPAVAAAFVDGGITPDKLAEWVKGGAKADAAPVVDPDPAAEYPIAAPGVGRWELSNGDIVTGKRVDAEEAEGALAETVEAQARATAKAHAAMTPEV